MVAGNAGRLPHYVIAQPAIRSIADLRGKTIGVLSNEEGTTHLVPEVTHSAGLEPSDYMVKAVGGAPTRWRLLRSGEIDAGLQPFPLSYEAEAAGFSNLGPLADFVPDWQFTSVNADLRWAERHRMVLVSALRALQRGLDAIIEDPAAAPGIDRRQARPRRTVCARTCFRSRISPGKPPMNRPAQCRSSSGKEELARAPAHGLTRASSPDDGSLR